MNRKPLTRLRARVEDGGVCVTAYKSTGAPADAKAFDAVRIHRKEATDFVFGTDYEEYFDGTDWRDAPVVFEGSLPAQHERKVTWVDDGVEVGSTYAYWVSAFDAAPVGPIPVKVRDREVWWSYARITQEAQGLQRDYPDRVRLEHIGRSVRGRDILGLRIGPTRPALGLVGAVHAGESGAELMLPAIRRILSARMDLIEAAGIVAIPVLNVDERERLVRGCPWYLRTNANGVDLNRNFPAEWESVSYAYGLDSSDPDSLTYRGPHAASEPETRALMEFLDSAPIDVLYAFHCLASICGGRFLGPACGKEDAGYVRSCRQFAATYLEGFDPEAPADSDKALSFGTASGSLPAWMHGGGVPAFDLEISAERESEALAQCREDHTDRTLLGDYRERHFRGIAAVLEKLAGSGKRYNAVNIEK